MTLSISRDDMRSGTLKTKAESPVSDEEMQQAVRTLLLGLGEDPDREGLVDTPKRVVKALKFLTSGYHQSLDELLNGAVFHENTNEMVLVRDIDPGRVRNLILVSDGKPTRGVIDTRDVTYFIFLIGFALMVSFRALDSRRWR